jgi:hypothetical protein
MPNAVCGASPEDEQVMPENVEAHDSQ